MEAELCTNKLSSTMRRFIKVEAKNLKRSVRSTEDSSFFETFFLKRSKFEKKINIRNKLSFIVPPFQKNGFSSEKNFSFKKLAEHGLRNVEKNYHLLSSARKS